MTIGASPRFPAALANIASFSTHQPHPLKSLDQLAVTTARHRGQEICSQGRPATTGIASFPAPPGVRHPARWSRQIVDLLLARRRIRFQRHDEYDYTVEAVAEGTIVARYPRRRVELLADADRQLAREIRQITLLALARLQAQLLILGRITATRQGRLFHSRNGNTAVRGGGNSVAFQCRVTISPTILPCRWRPSAAR